uniref:O-acyltransferase WSD1 C-terminal domain-containing protein n=1 Tax=Toxoplasma gondii (strain ATCC 50861 / VEG) TaxID=432359 RepID=A0A0F7V3E0_TOXGV|nr:TPA: hypothetical protein BN1205_060170 [Toxoplasma gondii VEG]
MSSCPEEATDQRLCPCHNAEHNGRSSDIMQLFSNMLGAVASGRSQDPDALKKTDPSPCHCSQEDPRFEGMTSKPFKNKASLPMPFSSLPHPLDTCSPQVITPPGGCLLTPQNVPLDTPTMFYSPEPVTSPPSTRDPLKKVLGCERSLERLETPPGDVFSLASYQDDRCAHSARGCKVFGHRQRLRHHIRGRQDGGASEEKWMDCCEEAEEQEALRVSIATPRPECASSRCYGEGSSCAPELCPYSPSRYKSSRSLPSRLQGRLDRPHAFEGTRLLIRSLDAQDHGFENCCSQESTDLPRCSSTCPIEQPTSSTCCKQERPHETCCFCCSDARTRSKGVPTSCEPVSLTFGENGGFSLEATTSTGTEDLNPFIYRTSPSTSLSTGSRRRRRKASLLVCPLPPPPAPVLSRESQSRHRPSWFIHTHPQFRHSRVQTLLLFFLRVRMRLQFSLQTLKRLLLLHPCCVFAGNAPIYVSNPASISWKQIVSRWESHGVNPRSSVSLIRPGCVGKIPYRMGSISSVSSLSKQDKAARSTIRALRTAQKRWNSQSRTSYGLPGYSEECISARTTSNRSEGKKTCHVVPPGKCLAVDRQEALQAESMTWMPEAEQLFSEPASKQLDWLQIRGSHVASVKTTAHTRERGTTDATHQFFSLLSIMLLPVTLLVHGVRLIRHRVFILTCGARPLSWRWKVLRRRILAKLYKYVKFLILLVTMFPFVHGLYLPGLALIWVVSRIRVACWWLYVNGCLGYRTSEQLHRQLLSSRRRRVRLNDQLERNKQATASAINEPGHPRDFISGWLCRTYVGGFCQWILSTEPIVTFTTWGSALWNVALACLRKLFIGRIDVSFVSAHPGLGVLRRVLEWEESSERTTEKLLRVLGETVPVIAELALSIAAATTALGATDSHLVAAVDSMTEKEAIAAAQPQGSVYMTTRRVAEDAAAGADSPRHEDVVKRLWRVGEGRWFSWPWRSTLVGSGLMQDKHRTREISEKTVSQYKAANKLPFRPPRRTEIFEVLSGQELMMFSQPLMIVSGVGFSDHLSHDDLIEVVETQLLAKREQASVGNTATYSDCANEWEPLTVYKHPRLRTVIGKLFGRYCWIRAEDFNVRNHVLKLNRHEALSLLRHHSGTLHGLHHGVVQHYKREQLRITDEEGLATTFSSSDSCGRYKDEILCDEGDNCKCVVTSAEAQALENVLATQALQPSMPLWQFVLLEHVELPGLDEGDRLEGKNSSSHKDDDAGSDDASFNSRRVGSMVMFRIHHAVADGIAITNMFLSDVLSAPCPRGSGHVSSSCGRLSEAHSVKCEAEFDVTSPPSRKMNGRSRSFPLQLLKGLYDELDTVLPLSRAQESISHALGASPNSRQLKSPNAGAARCPVVRTTITDQRLPTMGQDEGQDKRFYSSSHSAGDMLGSHQPFPGSHPKMNVPKDGSCGTTDVISGRQSNSSDRTEDCPVGTTVHRQKRPFAPDRRPVKSLVPPLRRPSSIFLRAFMQLISYLHVPFTVVSLLMLTEEKSWDYPEKPRPPRSGRVWVLQPIRFKLQELKNLRRALAALQLTKEKKSLNASNEQLQSDSASILSKKRIHRWSEHLRKEPLRNLLASVGSFIGRVAHRDSARFACLNSSSVKNKQSGDTQDIPAEAAAVHSGTATRLNQQINSIPGEEQAAKMTLSKQDLFTINELLATCLVGGICRYVHNKVAVKNSDGERLATLSRTIHEGRSKASEYQKYNPSGQQDQDNTVKHRTTAALPQTIASLNGTGQSATDRHSGSTKARVLPYNKSVSGLSGYSSSTCSVDKLTLPEDQTPATRENQEQILQMELDMLEHLMPQLNIVVPVNLRTTEEESFELRNNFTSAVVQVAAAHAFKAGSAYERLLGVRKSLRKSVKSLGAHVFALMEKISFCTTPDFLLFLQIWLTKKMSVLFSNVPGPSELPQIHGRQVHAMHFIGPLAGRISLIVSAFSYGDYLDLVITTDTAVLESPQLLRQCILDEYMELKQLCPSIQLS